MPVDTTFAAPIRRRIGATRRLAKSSPIQAADNSTIKRDNREHQGERDLNAEPPRFEIGIFADVLLRRTQLLHHARVEQAGDVEIHIVVAAQLDDRGDVIALGDERDLRIGFGGLAEQLRRRQHDFRRHRHVGALDRRTVGLDDNGGREIAAGGLRGEEFAELIAILIEDRLGAAKVVGHGQNLAADRLGVLVHIGVRDNQRLLDHGARARREETVEAAIERRRRDQGDKNCRHRGDHREQADDLDVQA